MISGSTWFFPFLLFSLSVTYFFLADIRFQYQIIMTIIPSSFHLGLGPAGYTSLMLELARPWGAHFIFQEGRLFEEGVRKAHSSIYDCWSWRSCIAHNCTVFTRSNYAYWSKIVNKRRPRLNAHPIRRMWRYLRIMRKGSVQLGNLHRPDHQFCFTMIYRNLRNCSQGRSERWFWNKGHPWINGVLEMSKYGEIRLIWTKTSSSAGEPRRRCLQQTLNLVEERPICICPLYIHRKVPEKINS